MRSFLYGWAVKLPIQSYLERCSKEQCFNCVIDLYTDGDEIVDGVRAGYDLIIMDIPVFDSKRSKRVPQSL